jgi:putative two-component system response regulator
MTSSGTVLLVDDDEAALESYAEMLRRHEDLRVLVASSGGAALDSAKIHRPDLVISDLRMPGMDGVALCQAIRAEASLEGILFVILTGDPAARETIEAATAIDDLLQKPITAAELAAKVAALLRLKRLHDQLRADKLEVERIHREVEQRFGQLLALLVHLVDVSVPGAAARSLEITRLAAQMAERFDIPAVLLRDLEIGAKLQEIGKLMVAEHHDSEGPEDLFDGDRWRYAVASKELLERVAGLEETAELIGSIFENWDGTGHPNRLRQGQIPLRSRILRLLIDYEAAVAAAPGATPVSALEQLQVHGGTRYDPLAVAYFDAIIRAATANPDWQATRTHVAILSLAEGMRLAEDLYTASGVKLLAKGQVITGPTLDTILRRHRSDPMVHGAWVERSSLKGAGA